MQSNIKVSVVVPVYNVEDYLEKCLESLVSQSLEEIEIIVINDGSTDNSKIIIEQYQQQFPEKIKSYLKENGGLSDARNYGIDRASGEFIGFVDSDDFVSKEMFLEMYTLAIKNKAEMVICNLQKVNEKGEIIRPLPQIPNMPEKIDVETHFSIFSDMSYFACNKLFSRSLFQSMRFQKNMHFEDIQLIPQLLLQCNTIAQTQEYYYQYLERNDSISKSHTEKGLDILKAVEMVEESFYKSRYQHQTKALKNFQILEGVYTFLAYLAFVKDDYVYEKMSIQLDKFIKERKISTKELLLYTRFGKNYLLSLPTRKKIYYLLYFLGLKKILRKLLK